MPVDYDLWRICIEITVHLGKFLSEKDQQIDY